MSSPDPTPALDAQTKFPSILAILIVGCVLSTTVVTLRFITRIAIIHTFGLDDLMIGIAQIFAIGSAVTIGFEAKYGMGRHVWVVPPENIVPYFQSLYSSILVYNAALTLVKISILLQYRRIFTTPSMQRATAIGLLLIGAWGITVVVMVALICVPIQFLWDKSIHGHCLPLLPVYYTPAAINIATDFGTWVLPLPIIKSLQLPRRQKIILMSIFGLGFFTCIISIVRLSALKTATNVTDPTWNNTDAAIWSYLELSMAILAACLPTLRPLAIKFIPNFIAGSSHQSAPNTNNYERHSPRSHSTWVSAKFSGASERTGTTGIEFDSRENLHQEASCNLQNFPSHKIVVESEFTVKTGSAV